MTDYLEYTKGGYVLIAPCFDYKHQYILKCIICDDYYGEFELFLSHCQSHYDEMFPKKLLSQSDDSLEITYSEVYKVNFDENIGRDQNKTTSEYYEDEIENIEIPKSKNIKDEDTDDSDLGREKNDFVSISREIDETHSYSKQEDEESINSIGDSNTSLYDPQSEADYSDDHMIFARDPNDRRIIKSKTRKKLMSNKFKAINVKSDKDKSKQQTTINNKEEDIEQVSIKPKVRSVSASLKRFMASNNNIRSLIQAYRNQPLLWNLNYMEYLRTKERLNCMQKIADDLKSDLNIRLTHEEVKKLILMLRIKYRSHLTRDTVINNLSEDLLKSLDFIRPFMENNNLAVLSENRTYLNNKQITQILHIYRNFPILWNTDLIEHWCKNKRIDSIDKMVKIINENVNLKVNRKLLETYLYAIHAFLTKEKRRDLGLGKEKGEQHPIYYNDLLFLYEHVSPFQCSICNKFLRNPLYFKKHMTIHDENMGLKCNLCHKQYKSAELYIDHAKRHMEDLDLECHICGKKFAKKMILHSHMRTHTNERSYVCETCGAAYRYASSLVIHKRKHTKEYIYHCTECPKKFISKTGLTTHMIVHRSDRNYVCPLCNKAYKSKDSLRHHSWTHADGSHPCEVCGKIFKHPYKVYVHMKIHRNEKNKKSKR